MKIRFPWQKKNQEIELESVENKLIANLQPINIRPEFVENLRKQIIGKQEKKFFGIPAGILQIVLVALGAAASLVLLVVAGLRIIIWLVSGKRIFRKVADPDEDSRPDLQSTPE